MKNLVKVIMPVAAFMLASAGAVSTNGANSTKNATVAIQGWNRVSPNAPCTELRMCNNVGSTICTLSGVQAFEKVGANCTKELYHKN
ncbi:DUF6520 family protein [Flavobacterium aquidurense]|jgi:hypothetical protein|uniref:DUF333 domain-containing protein n=2 Tax=Flavobacterium TaxID=237 RepID=A0A4R5CCY5_9FLAO|nr:MULTISPECIES: DUF6520 family protein [Flavobacterium]EIA07299.1 hypothetical protein HJ01_03417 [Flavobacterium frigoris PS1]TDD97871.1 hypothetical protein E0F76_07160 [Flavobacterium cellulosilyticum]